MSSKQLETRTRILQAALDLLLENQGKGVRMSDIARQANVSRQALYLHFKTRTDLLIETTRYVDELNNIDRRLAPSRTAKSGIARLNKYIDGWGNYIPEIYFISKALLSAKETDGAPGIAWANRMQAVRHGCEAAIQALSDDGVLTSEYSIKDATDILWTLLSVQNWEQLIKECQWSQKKYIASTKSLAKKMLVSSRSITSQP